MQLPTIDKDSVIGDKYYKPPRSFPIGPTFTKYSKNPILKPDPKNAFESAFVYNATAIVVNDLVFLLYRAQGEDKISRIGIAWSEDGFNFRRYYKPIIGPTEPWEMKGGCEDPRIIWNPDKKLFILTYTAYDSLTARLCVATSRDIFHWKKQPPIIESDNWSDIAKTAQDQVIIRHGWLKSGAVFTEKNKDGKYYMIWGDSAFHLAESEDSVHWKLTSNDYGSNLFTTGVFNWQNYLIEPGPAPIKIEYSKDPLKNHYVLFYNSGTNGAGKYPKGSYTISQMLIDYDDLSGPLARLEYPVVTPTLGNETNGQVDNVVFTEGLVQFHGKWFLYFGQADTELGVATCDVEN